MSKIKAFLIALLLMAGVGEMCAQQLDSVVREALDKRLSEYFSAIEREGTDVQKGECDFLIETCTDSLMRQHVALTVYDHYRDSKVMGSEAVAIHVFDRWIAPGKVRMRSDAELMAARIFAEFNRKSQIGNKAPPSLLFIILMMNLLRSMETVRQEGSAYCISMTVRAPHARFSRYFSDTFFMTRIFQWISMRSMPQATRTAGRNTSMNSLLSRLPAPVSFIFGTLRSAQISNVNTESSRHPVCS